jgi:predicted AAA+ superfamily ATPase
MENIECENFVYTRTTMEKVLKSIAKNDETYVNNDTLAKDAQISIPTLNNYLNILNDMCLLETIYS